VLYIRRAYQTQRRLNHPHCRHRPMAKDRGPSRRRGRFRNPRYTPTRNPGHEMARRQVRGRRNKLERFPSTATPKTLRSPRRVLDQQRHMKLPDARRNNFHAHPPQTAPRPQDTTETPDGRHPDSPVRNSNSPPTKSPSTQPRLRPIREKEVRTPAQRRRCVARSLPWAAGGCK